MKFPRISFGNREDTIVQGVQNHLSVVAHTIDAFVRLVDAAGAGKTAEAASHLKEVLDGEGRADAVHRSLSMQIAQGAFFGGVREDILDLLEKIDNIADSAKDAARLIGQEEELDEFARSFLSSESMREFLAHQMGAVRALEVPIRAFKIGKKEVLANIPKVEEEEEAADANKVELLHQLFSATERTSPVTIIQMRDFVSISDDIADNAEDASDVIWVLIAKGYD